VQNPNGSFDWLVKEATAFRWAVRLHVGLVVAWILAGQVLRQFVTHPTSDQFLLPDAVAAIALLLFYAIPLELFFAFFILVFWGALILAARWWVK